MTPEERLAAFEAFAAEVRAELTATSEHLDGLKARGRERSATFRQLMAQRLALRSIVERLERFGL